MSGLRQGGIDSQRPAPPRQPPAWSTQEESDTFVWRCSGCQRVLGEYQPPIGLVSHRCKRCGTQNTLTTEDAA